MAGKLIGGRIPEIIRADGKTPVIREISGEEYRSALREKLQEEAQEYLEAPISKSLEEPADILEVVRTLAEVEGHSYEKLLEETNRKQDLVLSSA